MKLAGLMRRKIAVLNWIGGAALAVVANAAHALAEPWQLNMTQGVTKTSQEVYAMHMYAFYVCVVIGVVVFGAMIWAMIFHRKSRGAVAARWSHNTHVEVIWTILPIIILVSLAWPATNVLLNMAYTEKSDMTIKVTGYQWKWGYDYINVGDKPYHVHFISRLDPLSDKTRELKSGMDPNAVVVKDDKGNEEKTYLLDVDKPLVIPADTKVRFLVTGDDVIHAWWVPQIGWKQDAIPGIINDAWTEVHDTGIYRGQCAELCGQDHGFMPIVVKVVSKADFQTWIDQQEAAMQPATQTPAAPAATAPNPPPAAPSAS
jgi:cytochrome c oxidase subunit II